MKILLVIIFFLALIKFVYPIVESEEILDTIGLIAKWGYPAEQHNVTTDDGYILNIFRIPWSPVSTNKTSDKPVILIQCGILASSDGWVLFGPNRSLAMQLADEGYDVWMGNNRGTTYGRTHVTLSPDEKKFWDFSFHEMGVYDNPAVIDYILNLTNQPSLKYIGYSLSTTTVFVTLSELPEFNEKINLVLTFSPIAGWFIKHPLRRFLSTAVYFLQSITDPNGTFEVLPQSTIYGYLLNHICIEYNIFEFCMIPIDITTGQDHYQIDQNKLVDFIKYYPSGTSAKTLWHYQQLEYSHELVQYDYKNDEENIHHYGESKPPKYKLKNVSTTVIIFYGKNDPLVTEPDTIEITKRISSKVIIEPVPYENFNHFDFVTAKDIKKLFNDRVIERLNQFRKVKNILKIQKNRT